MAARLPAGVPFEARHVLPGAQDLDVFVEPASWPRPQPKVSAGKDAQGAAGSPAGAASAEAAPEDSETVAAEVTDAEEADGAHVVAEKAEAERAGAPSSATGEDGDGGDGSGGSGGAGDAAGASGGRVEGALPPGRLPFVRQRVEVCAKPLLLRSDADTSSELLAKLRPGQLLTVLEERVMADGDVRAKVALIPEEESMDLHASSWITCDLARAHGPSCLCPHLPPAPTIRIHRSRSFPAPAARTPRPQLVARPPPPAVRPPACSLVVALVCAACGGAL